MSCLDHLFNLSSVANMIVANSKIRGTFIIDNNRQLKKKVRKGENIDWIINYVFCNPGIGANQCRKALCRWRGIRVCDASRGQYASYFYDYYAIEWYHKQHWTSRVFSDLDNRKRLLLTTKGLGRVDQQMVNRIKKWDNSRKD